MSINKIFSSITALALVAGAPIIAQTVTSPKPSAPEEQAPQPEANKNRRADDNVHKNLRTPIGSGDLDLKLNVRGHYMGRQEINVRGHTKWVDRSKCGEMTYTQTRTLKVIQIDPKC